MLIVVRSVGRELRKLMYFLPRFLGLLILSIIPVVNAIAPFAWIIFGGWMMAIQYTDYAADNNQISFEDLRRRLDKSPFQAVLFGVIVYFLVAIPIINLILIPVYGIVGAALASLISKFAFNLFKYFFLWKKLNFQPFSWKTLNLIGIGLLTVFLIQFLPVMSNFIIDIILRSFLISLFFGLAVLVFRLSSDLNLWAKKILNILRN